MFQQLGDWVAFQLLGLDPTSHLGNAVQFFVMDVTKIFALLFAIIYVMGFLRAFMTPEKIRDIVRGKPKWLARLMAILLGSVTPFCSCSSVPLFIGFVEAGIPLSITYAFLIASPMINEVAVAVLIGVVGWKITLLYVVAGMVVAYVGSIVMEWFKTERWVEDYVWKIHMAQSSGEAEKRSMTLKAHHQFAVHEVKEIIRRLWKWVIIGVAVGAAFHGYVPQEWVAENLAGEGHWWSVPAAVLIGVPLYSNATGVIPIAEAMLGKGVPIGTTLALMMSIAALSLPEMLILRKVIRWPALALYASVLAIAFMGVGWIFNLLLS
ncbi:permease [Galenea microaerophila]